MNDTPATKACCTPSTDGRHCQDGVQRQPPQKGAADITFARATSGSTEGMVLIPSGSFWMGTEDEDAWEADGEGPVREVQVDAFWIDRTVVTNAAFEQFVQATDYQTESERFGWSYVFLGQLSPSRQRKLRQSHTVQGLQWWYAIDGACWRKPEGPGSHIHKRMDHPVVHITWNDAMAYCHWAGKRLPTEAEWEKAARGGLARKRFCWGDELEPEGKHRCNIWQGKFPDHNTEKDGYPWAAPAKSFKPNGYGLYNMAGNVWEWCFDWFNPGWHIPETPETRINPKGPDYGKTKSMRGGSFLCHHSYCNRYRVAARTSNTPDSSTTNLGFRCVRDEVVAG